MTYCNVKNVACVISISMTQVLFWGYSDFWSMALGGDLSTQIVQKAVS